MGTHTAKGTLLSEEKQVKQNWKERRTFFLIAVSSGTLLNPLNSSMISMALHSIQHAFALSFTTASWVISAFYLASAIGQPLMGKLGDEFGRKTIFLSGLIIAAIAAVSAPFSATFAVLVTVRILQAIGTSAIYPSGMGLVREHIQKRQASALAVISIFSSVTVALGPSIGGFLIVWGGWPAIFLINLPFIIISFLLAWLIFPKDKKRVSRKLSETIRYLDIPGILLFGLAMMLLLWFLLSFKTKIHYVSGIFGIVCATAFIRRELRVEEPFINVRMFRDHMSLTWVNVLFIVLNVYNYALLFALPTYFQDELKLSIEITGMLMLFISGFGIIVSPLTGKWVDRSGIMPPLLLGSCCMLAGALLLTFFFHHVTVYTIIPALSVMGMGYGFNNVSLQSAMLRAAPPDEVGVASGLFQTSRYMGSIFSSVLLGLVFGKDVNPSNLQLLGAILIAVALFSIWMSFRFSKL
ncbi:MFS transporter [Bacillus sp. 165]|uniref:MFS transporter n=1 Tax=Bacillus sp. 165 TaxID=1529117 RepID=UPI001ADB9FB4|nr:MFS transporter [Bacillus sp. 165]MBO9130748.1 MFS transporter [Bacillus sp. 165]